MTLPDELPQYDWQKPRIPFQMGRLFGRVWRVFVEQPKSVFTAILVATLAGLAIGAVQITALSPSGTYDAANAAANMGQFWQITLVTSVISYLLYTGIWIFADQLTLAHTLGRYHDWRVSTRRGLKMSVPILLISLLVAIVSYFAMIFFIIPGIFLLVCWAVYAPCFLNEPQTGFFGCLGRSWRLTKRYRGMVWLSGLIMLVIMFCGLTLALVPTMISTGGADALLSGTAAVDLSFGYWAAIFISSVLMYLTTMIYASYTAALYLELLDLKEGGYGASTADIFD